MVLAASGPTLQRKRSGGAQSRLDGLAAAQYSLPVVRRETQCTVVEWDALLSTLDRRHFAFTLGHLQQKATGRTLFEKHVYSVRAC